MQLKIFIYILVLSVVITMILKELFQNKSLSFYSVFKNVLVLAIIYIGYKLDKRIILIIPILYVFLYLFFPIYSGQDIFLIPISFFGDIMNNIQKIQGKQNQQDALNDSRIDITDRKWNLWYEYHHFLHHENIYYFWMNKPGKYDDFFNIQLYSSNINNNTNNMHYINRVVPNKSYKQYKKKDDNIVIVSHEDIYYYSSINFIDKRTHTIIKSRNINIEIKGKISVADNYCISAILQNIFPFNYIIKYGAKFMGVSDIYPNEWLNDTAHISDSEIIVNTKKENNIHWQDIYIGNGHYYMTHYIWIMNYTENFIIFTLWYSDYPYNDFYVGFVYDKKKKKNIETGNIFLNSNFNKMFTGVSASINTFGSKLCNDTIKYEINYESPKIKLNIKNLNNSKAIDQFPIYKRLSKGKNYGKGEELHQLMEQTTYSEFSGKSIIELEYNNEKYNEIGTTVIDGVSWKDCKSNPDGYKRDGSFFKNPFYVYHRDKDKLNGKIIK